MLFIRLQFISSHIKLRHVRTRKFDKIWSRGWDWHVMDREKEIGMVFAQIASIVCVWFYLFRYQGCSEEVKGCYFQRRMLAEEVIFCPRIWTVFSQQPAVCFPRWEPDARQETSRVVRMGLLSRRDYYCATCYYCATICHYCATIVPPAARVPCFEMEEWMTPMLCTAL